MALRKEDQYDLSSGNLSVLRAVPDMMMVPKYRKQLRELTIKFLMEHPEQGMKYMKAWQKDAYEKAFKKK